MSRIKRQINGINSRINPLLRAEPAKQPAKKEKSSGLTLTGVRVKITRKAGCEASGGASGKKKAGMVELVDSVDLGSTAKSVQVRVLLPAPYRVFITDLSYEHSFLYLRPCKTPVPRPGGCVPDKWGFEIPLEYPGSLRSDSRFQFAGCGFSRFLLFRGR